MEGRMDRTDRGTRTNGTDGIRSQCPKKGEKISSPRNCFHSILMSFLHFLLLGVKKGLKEQIDGKCPKTELDEYLME